MRVELGKASRDFGLYITTTALPEYWEYWSNYPTSYRCGPDPSGDWKTLLEVYQSYFKFCHCRRKGHYQDFDLLEFGTFHTGLVSNKLTEDEAIIAYSIRAFLNSSIQIGSTLEDASEFELSLYCNEEIIALNQDCAFSGAHPIYGNKDSLFNVFEMKTEDSGYAYGIFNMTEEKANVKLTFEKTSKIRDVWAKEDLVDEQVLLLDMMPHTVRIIKTNQKLSETQK